MAPLTPATAYKQILNHLADRDFGAMEDFTDYTRNGEGYEPLEVIAVALLRIARALERAELPANVRALADEPNDPPPPSKT